MDVPAHLKQRIIEAVTRFEMNEMSVCPQCVAVDLDARSLAVTLRGLSCPAEERMAAYPGCAEMLERFHDSLFNAVKPALEAAVAEILGRRVCRSKLTVDPGSSSGFIVFTFAGDEPRRESVTTQKGTR